MTDPIGFGSSIKKASTFASAAVSVAQLRLFPLPAFRICPGIGAALGQVYVVLAYFVLPVGTSSSLAFSVPPAVCKSIDFVNLNSLDST